MARVYASQMDPEQALQVHGAAVEWWPYLVHPEMPPSQRRFHIIARLEHLIINENVG